MSARQIKRRRVRNMAARLRWVAWLFGRADDVRLFVAPLSAIVVSEDPSPNKKAHGAPSSA